MGRKPGTTSFDEEQALELYHQGLTDRAIGDKLFVSQTSICAWRRRLGLAANFAPMYRGKRPEVTVDIPPDLAASKIAPEPSPPVDGGAADSQQEDRQNLPPPTGGAGLPINISFSVGDFSAGLSAPNYERALAAAELLLAAVKAAGAVPKTDTNK